MLDHKFLVATIIVVIALLFYILYWNKFIAFLIGLAFRVVLWNRGASSVWIHIGSIHVSVLAGRILLKDFCYHSSNQTIKIVKVQLRWQYWLRSFTPFVDMQAHSGGEEQKGGNASQSPRCRFHATFEGIEWFIFNRTAAFDNIVAQMEATSPDSERRAHSLSADGAASHLRQIFTMSSAGGDSACSLFSIAMVPQSDPTSCLVDNARTHLRSPFNTPMFLRNFVHWLRGQLPDLDVKDLLPFSFEGLNGGIVCGNMATSNILVAEFSRADGMFGTVPSKSDLDLYKQLLNVKFWNATISLKENDQYLAPMTSTGSHIHTHFHKAHSLSSHYFHFLTYPIFSKLYHSARLRDGLRAATNMFKKRPISSAKTFLSRSKRAQSVDVETPVGPDCAKHEYAIERRLLEAPVLELSYYVDVVGVVPVEPRRVDHKGYDVGNGGTSPEWGFDLVVYGGFLRYGPWADRQRAELQRVFFPPTYQEADQTHRLRPGDNRIWTTMRIFVELRRGSTLHIPFREASKNWQWDGHVNVPRPRTREAASLSIKAGDDSTICYLMPVVADAQGYHPHLKVHLNNVTVSSSLNDIRLLATKSCEISGEMPSPLKWDAGRQWIFTVSLSQPIFYLLRDHINMLTDLGKDWNSGPPSNYSTWVPMRYIINLDLHDYEINTYVNDHNIIDKPHLGEENALLTFRGASLHNENVILSDKFRPVWTSFPFSISAPNVILSLTLPKWSTHRLLTVEPITKLMTVGLLHLDGSYLYHTDVREENVDQLRLKFILNDTIFKCLAWSIRHFMIFQQNYFGNFTHFSTLREYLQKHSHGQIGDPIDMKYRPGLSNKMQVELQLSLIHSLIVLPVGLPGYEMYCPLPDQSPEDVHLGGCILFSAPETEMQLRSHNLGLEMNLNIGTIYGDVESNHTERSIFTRSQWFPSSEVFLIEGVDILADRLFGPQPLAATYVCCWEINFSSVKGIFSASHGRTLQSAFDAFAMNYKDPMNAPAAEFALPLAPDVTFLKVSLASIDLTWSSALVSVHFSLPQGFHIASNDLAGNNYRKVSCLSVPEVIIRFLHSLGKGNDWVEAGEVVFDAALDNYFSPSGWQESALSQAKFLAEQDEPTGRLRRLKIGLRNGGRRFPSRSVYAAVLRLPRPHLAPSSTTHAAPPADDMLQGTDLMRPTPFFQRHVYSDSDDEASYTAMDRDARLANSRPTSMLPLVQAGDESMSDGDESDDIDLTDGSSYGSDVSEWNEGSPTDSEHSFAFHYSRVSRHYGLPIGKPSLWAGNPVVILRDRRPFSAPVERPEVTLKEDEHCPYKLWKADIIEGRSSTSTIRALSHSVEIWVTPLLSSVIIHLVKDNSRAAMSLEQRIDSLTTSHIRDFLKEKDTVNDSIFDFQISSIRVQIVQLVRRPRSQHDGFLHVPEITDDHPKHKGGVLNLEVLDLGLKAQVHEEEKRSRQSFAISTSHVGLSLDLHDVHDPANRSAVHNVVKASLSEVTTTLVHKRADMMWRTLSVVLEMDAADCVSEVVSAHTDHITQAVDTYRRLQSRFLSEARVRVHQTLQWSKKLSVVDPLSTIQPSYLIQTGRPNEIRVHAASKILLYIRSCLRFLTAEEREALSHLTGVEDTVVTREEVVALLQGQLAGLAMDADATGLANLNLFIRIFGAPNPSDVTRSHERAIQIVRIKLQTTKVAVLHPKHGPPSEVTLDMIDITTSLKKSELLVGTSRPQKDPTSARDKHRSVVQHVGISVVLDGLEVLMLPHILNFAQSLVLLRKRLKNITPISPSISPLHLAQAPSKTTFLIDATLSLQSLRLQVAAEKLIVAFIVSRLGFVSSAYARPHLTSQGPPDLSANSSLFFDSVALQAHSSADTGSLIPQDMLAEILLRKTAFNCALRHEVALNLTIRAALAVDRLQLSVPRSAIRLSKFIEEWKADYLPSFEQTIQALVSELRQGHTVPSSPTNAKHLVPTTHLQISMGSCGVFLHVLPGTWLAWELIDTVAYLKLGVGVVHSRPLSAFFGLRFSSQRIGIASLSKGERLEDALEIGGLKVDLPSMTVTGTYDNHGGHVLVSAGFFSITVKQSYWDTLLSVQQKFGNDINDLLHVLADARMRRVPPQGPAKSQPSSSQLLQSGAFKAKGFRIGLEGHSSTLFFECQDISGGLTDGESKGKGKSWQLNVIGLALSLAPRSYTLMKSESGRFDGHRRSAFVIIDCKIEVNHRIAQKFLAIKVSKIHAIMQPSSIGEIGDFIDHLQAEVLNRKDERVDELAAFKKKTQSILKTFGVNNRESIPSDAMVWFKDYAVVFSVSNVGVAFPLALDSTIEPPLGKHHQHPAVSAFLFSVKAVEFEDKNKGDSQFVMKGFSFQFVDRFRQSIPGNFSGDVHQTRNRLIYPDMTAKVRTELSTKSRRIRLGASISGFILDLEPSIADHIASLVDVYRRGKERVDRITVNVPRSAAVQDLRPSLRRAVSGSNEAVPTTSSILLSMVFLSGQVRMHSSSPRASSQYDVKGHGLPASVIESFNLPMLSVWGEYRASLASRGPTTDQNGDPSSLVLKSTIHSSENTLRPTLLPFITELVNHIERRMHKASSSSSSFSNRDAISTALSELNPPNDNPPVSSMHITFALRIDQSKLQLTCQPDVNVIAGAYWDSGGFLLNVSRSGRRISFIGNVGGLTIGLKHGFLSEDCVRLDARNLSFSTTFTGAEKSSGIDVSSMSIVLDTEVAGGLHFSRFQDVLCFKAVWLDRIPVLSATPNDEFADNPVKAKVPPTPGAVSTKDDFVTALLVRFRRIKLNVDLGQSISSVRMDMLDVTLRSRIEQVCAELSVAIGDLTMSATGNISGHAHIPDFLFNTMHRNALVLDSHDRLGEPKMLDMSMKVGNLEMTLESDYQKILHLWSEPLSVTMSPEVAVLDRLLRLSFAVSGTELIAVGSVGTIPKLFSYGSRFRANLQVQREGAARESKAFRIAQSPKPDNPLSAFANAMLQTARTRLREKEEGLSYVVQQRMQFSLGSLKLVVFPRTMEDNEMASFSASELRADLDFIIESNDLPAKRKLLLAFAGMSASRVGPLDHGMVPDDVRTNVRKWLDTLQKGMSVSTIFELPAMDMDMESEEGGKPTARREDIFITLNVALYSWLTLLRKNLAREMRQAQGSLDRRQAAALSTATPSGVSTPKRRRTITESSTLDITSPMMTSPIDRHASPQPRGDAAIERLHKTTLSMSAMPSKSDMLGPPIELAPRSSTMSLLDIPTTSSSSTNAQPPPSPIAPAPSSPGHPPSLLYQPRRRHIERLQMRQLGEATPDVMHPFFTKKAGFSLEDALPQYVHEYATMPIEEITRALLKLYSRQLSHSALQ
ncbi:hypothetical protein BJV74DRAFT_946145 [Russula compacta]|nr:hypothetical protein BJV74DRAFT_946145 [Russula compacta]